MTREELLTAAKPILFSTSMVRAVLDGRKSVTRRVIKYKSADPKSTLESFCNGNMDLLIGCCPYRKDDILYVRETWNALPVTPGGHMRGHDVYYFKADGDLRPEAWRGKWRPSIHMPKKAARIFLRVTDVRVERLRDITEEQCFREGVAREAGKVGAELVKEIYQDLWDSLYRNEDLPLYGWDANPWVWVIEFERMEEA